VPIRTEPYLVALGDVGNNILDARSAHNRGPSSLPVNDGLNVFGPSQTSLGVVYFWKPLRARLDRRET